MLPAPHQKPYTLLLSMDDLLVTSTWDVSSVVTTFVLKPTPYLSRVSPSNPINNFFQRQHGWRTAKRPGVDYFLAYLSQFYEIVIFTTQHHYVRHTPLSFKKPSTHRKCVTDRATSYRKAGSVQLLYHVQALPRVHAQLPERSSERFIIP